MLNNDLQMAYLAETRTTRQLRLIIKGNGGKEGRKGESRNRTTKGGQIKNPCLLVSINCLADWQIRRNGRDEKVRNRESGKVSRKI